MERKGHITEHTGKFGGGGSCQLWGLKKSLAAAPIAQSSSKRALVSLHPLLDPHMSIKILPLTYLLDWLLHHSNTTKISRYFSLLRNRIYFALNLSITVMRIEKLTFSGHQASFNHKQTKKAFF